MAKNKDKRGHAGVNREVFRIQSRHITNSSLTITIIHSQKFHFCVYDTNCITSFLKDNMKYSH